MRGKIQKIAAGLFLLLAMSLAVLSAQAQAEDLVITIDPGHGGTETGVGRIWSGIEYREEIVNLKIAQYLKEELLTYEGVQVFLTRETNDFSYSINREERLLMAKGFQSDVLVSIHNNSSGQTKADRRFTGAHAYVPSSATSSYFKSFKYAKKYKESYVKTSKELASSILTQLNAQVGIKNNGQMYDDELGIILYGMKYRIPSMIIEHCFISNPDDCKQYLKTEEQLKKLGVADATGIALYYGLQKKTDTAPQEPAAYTGWKVIEGKTYYFIEDVKQTGLITVDGKMYMLDGSGARKKGFFLLDGKRYYADSKGRLKTGWRTYKGKKYYFDKKTGAALSGKKKIGGRTYYFNKKTFAQTILWVKIAGKKYYFSKVDGHMLTRYWLLDRTTGKWYYLSKTGAAYANTTKTIRGVKYKFNKNGVCLNK